MACAMMRTPFQVHHKGLEIAYDPNTQQECLSFSFALQVSLTQLMQDVAMLRQHHQARPPVQASPDDGQCGGGGMDVLFHTKSPPGYVVTPPLDFHAAAARAAPPPGFSPADRCWASTGGLSTRMQTHTRDPDSQFRSDFASSCHSADSRKRAQDDMGQQAWNVDAVQIHAQQTFDQQKQHLQQQHMQQRLQQHQMKQASWQEFQDQPQHLQVPRQPRQLQRSTSLQVPQQQRPQVHHGSHGYHSHPSSRLQSKESGVFTSHGSTSSKHSQDRHFEMLMEAVCSGAVTRVASMLGQDSSFDISDNGTFLLQRSILAGANPEIISLLLEAKANVNTKMQDGTTLMHLAISRHLQMPPISFSLLILSKADLSIPDAHGKTPLDIVRDVAQQHAGVAGVDKRTLYMMQELMELPTIAVRPIGSDNEARRGNALFACFADRDHDRIAYHDGTIFGVYSLAQKTIQAEQRLSQKQQDAGTLVTQMVANLEVGAIAMLLEVDPQDPSNAQTLIMVFGNGELQLEEPLKISVAAELDRPNYGQSELICTSSHAMLLLARLRSGSVILWQLSNSCSRVLSEDVLSECGDSIAMSSDGSWIVVSESESTSQVGASAAAADLPKGSTISYWLRRPGSNPQETEKIRWVRLGALPRKAKFLAVARSKHDGSGVLAMVADTESATRSGKARQHRLSFPHVEIFALSLEGACEARFQVEMDCMCRAVRFINDSPMWVMLWQEDGKVVVKNIVNETSRVSLDDPLANSMCITEDQKLVVSTSNHCLRVHKFAAPPS